MSLKTLHSRRTCLIVQGVWHVEHCGCCFCLSNKECEGLLWPIRNRVIVTCSFCDFGNGFKYHYITFVILFIKYSYLIPTNCHHHNVVPPARISLTLSRHFPLLFIAAGRSSGLHPVSSHSCCMYVRAGRPAFAWPYVGVYRSTSLMSSFLLLQQCPACLVRLTCIVFVMGGKWPYSWCLVGCCRQDLFNISLNILV